jgi:hypothetical protein
MKDESACVADLQQTAGISAIRKTFLKRIIVDRSTPEAARRNETHLFLAPALAFKLCHSHGKSPKALD